MSSCGDRVSWETWREQISANGYYEDGARQEMITPNVKKTWLFINIAKGTTDPRVKFISHDLTQILIRFQFQNLD